MRKILDIIFSENTEFIIRFVFGLITALLLLSVSLFGQTTFTDEEMINLENEFIYLENKVDSLSYQDSLKAVMISTLEDELNLTNQELKLTNEQLVLTEKKVKLVKPSWFENKWLYFGYGAALGYSVTTLINQITKLGDL
tara:strand:- start:224 stop:643 length:420 start_codon:yes stop_codon:yes gene_type:complete